MCTGMVPTPERLLVYAGLGQEPTERSGRLGNLQLWLGELTGLLEPQAAGMGNHGSLQEQEQTGALLQLKAPRTLKLQSPKFLLTPRCDTLKQEEKRHDSKHDKQSREGYYRHPGCWAEPVFFPSGSSGRRKVIYGV